MNASWWILATGLWATGPSTRRTASRATSPSGGCIGRSAYSSSTKTIVSCFSSVRRPRRAGIRGALALRSSVPAHTHRDRSSLPSCPSLDHLPFRMDQHVLLAPAARLQPQRGRHGRGHRGGHRARGQARGGAQAPPRARHRSRSGDACMCSALLDKGAETRCREGDKARSRRLATRSCPCRASST